MARPIESVLLFMTDLTGQGRFDKTEGFVRVNPPRAWLEESDLALGFGGELLRWIDRQGMTQRFEVFENGERFRAFVGTLFPGRELLYRTCKTASIGYNLVVVAAVQATGPATIPSATSTDDIDLSIPTRPRVLTCDSCRRQLKYRGGRHGDYDGTVCLRCQVAFCPTCLDCRRSMPCPRCNEGTAPAMEANIRAFPATPARPKPPPPKPATVAELTETLLSNNHPEIVKPVFAVLTRHADRPAVIELLVRIARRGFIYRDTAIQALTQIGGTDVGAALLPLMDDSDISIRQATITGLGQCRVRAAVPRLIVSLEEDNDESTRAADALALIGDSSAIPALERCRPQHASTHRQERFAIAIRTLAERSSTPQVDSTASPGEDPMQLNIRAAIARAGSVRPRPAFLKRLRDSLAKPRDIREYTAKKLALNGEAYELVRLIRHADKKDLFYVTRHALADFRESPDAVDLLVKVAQGRRFADNRPDAIMGLARIRGDAAARGLLPVMEDPDFSIRQDVIAALGRCRSPLAVPRLVQSLAADDDECTHAADALGKIGDPSAIPGLERRLSQLTSEYRQQRLRLAIERIKNRQPS